MKIQQLDFTIRDLVAGYHDDGGVGGYGRGSLLRKQLDKLTE